MKPIVGPELEFYVLEPVRDRAHRLEAVRRGHRQRLRRRAQGRPREHPARVAAPALRLRPRRGRGQPRVLLAASSRSTCGTPRRSTRPTARSGSRPPSRSWPGMQGKLATFMAKPFNDEGGSGFHIHFSTWSDDGRGALRRPRRRGRPLRHGPPGDRRRAGPRPGAGRPAQPDDQLLQAVRPRHPGALADRLGPGQPQRDGPDPARARPRLADGAAPRRRVGEPLPRDRRASSARPTSASATSSSRRPSSRATATTPAKAEHAARRPARPRSTRSRPTPTCATCSGRSSSRAFVAYKRNELERFSHWVTDWEFREYGYHL